MFHNEEGQSGPSSGTLQHIDKVEFKVPPFSPDRPVLWFQILESQFASARITSEQSKYTKLTGSLNIRELVEVSDFFDNVPARDPYTVLKNLLIERLTESRSKQIQQLLYKQELGDRKPSAFLRELRRLNNGSVNDEVLRNIWLNALPRDVQRVIAGTRAALDEVSVQADAILEITSVRKIDAVAECANIQTGGMMQQLQNQISELTKVVNSMRDRQSRSHNSRSRGTSSRRRSFSRPRNSSNDSSQSGFCYYHDRFGANARNCRKPCNFDKHNKNDKGNDRGGQ